MWFSALIQNFDLNFPPPLLYNLNPSEIDWRVHDLDQLDPIRAQINLNRDNYNPN
jgi:hypothetical protein